MDAVMTIRHPARPERFLLEGETLLWEGRPVPFRTLDGIGRWQFVRKCLLHLSGLAVITAGFLAASSWWGRPASLAVPGFLLLFDAMIILASLDHYTRFGTKARYVVTSRRVLCYVDDAWQASLRYDQIDQMDILPQENGNCSLRLGRRAVRTPANRLRRFALDAITIRVDGRSPGLVFYNMPPEDAQTAARVIQAFRLPRS